jgi:ribosomal protein L40E
MEKKKCKKCGAMKPISAYQIRKESGKLRNECNDCLNAYHREFYLRKIGKFKRDAKAEKREAEEKICIRCKELKPISEFGLHNIQKNQHRNFCKQCQKEWDSKYKTSTEGKQKIDEWREKNQEKIIAYRELYKTDPRKKEKMRNYGRKNTLKQFGLTQEDYDKILQSQNGHCAICGNGTNGNKKNFCVDHDHETGKVRGLLCHNCNVSVGLMKESPLLLRKAAEYLESFKN